MSDLEKKIIVAEDLKSKLDELTQPSWEASGTTTEDFVINLKKNLDDLNQVLKSGQGDTSEIISTVKNTFEFISWALVVKEVNNTKNIIDAHVVREKINGTSSKKRPIKRG